MKDNSFFVRGDIDGFFGLFIDNLVNLVIIVATLTGLFEMPADIVFGKVVPGAAIAIIFGNIVYTIMAKRLAQKEGRRDVTALPYGISTPIMFAYLFLIIGPVYWTTKDPVFAWKVGIASAFIGGVVEFLGAFVGRYIRKYTPRAGLLGTLAGIAITWIAMKPSLGIWELPLIGFLPLAIILIGFIAKIYLPFRLPAGFTAIILGSAVAWIIGFTNFENVKNATDMVSFYLPTPVFASIIAGLKNISLYLVVILPLGIYNFLETMQNVESAATAGDNYDTKTTMMFDGLGTILGCIFGSCFPTTVYIGHPGWKAVGARQGYSLINGCVIFLIGITGMLSVIYSLIPKEVAFCILLYIGLVITSQAFTSVEKKYAPAVAIAFIPHIASYVKMNIDGTLLAAGTNIDKIGYAALAAQGISYAGVSALGYGAIVTGMLLGSITVFLIDKKFNLAGIYAFSAALLAYFGIIHFEKIGFGVGKSYAIGYLILTIFFLGLYLYERVTKKELKRIT
ncbi:MAG: regulator [Elusimicrobia bacterium]|nr:regulator [Elusimicrobiota bacterium]